MTDYEEYLYVLEYIQSWENEELEHPLVQGIGEDAFTLLEIVPVPDADIAVGDRVFIGQGDREQIDHVRRRLDYDELTWSARADIEEVLQTLITANEDRFIECFNTAQPVSVRRHQLNLLPGIGDGLRDRILEERDRQPFTYFDDLASRVSGLPTPSEALAERIHTELQNDDLRYRLFVESDQ